MNQPGIQSACLRSLCHKHNLIYYNPSKTDKKSVRTSQETCYVSATKPNRLLLFREELTVYCENHMEHTNTLCGQNVEF
jgi:hypothetical protein